MLDDINKRELILQLQNLQSNIKIAMAVPMGLIMILYFFTYATLLDQGLHGLLWFEMISTEVFVAALVKINRLSFVLLKLWYRKRSPHNGFLNCVKYADLAKPAQDLVEYMK